MNEQLEANPFGGAMPGMGRGGFPGMPGGMPGLPGMPGAPGTAGDMQLPPELQKMFEQQTRGQR